MIGIFALYIQDLDSWAKKNMVRQRFATSNLSQARASASLMRW
jgi:hypothetical protein